MKEVLRYRKCFVCGEENLFGLKARFYFDGHEAFCRVVAREEYEGYRGVYHGGITATLLDEVMLKAILALNVFAVTAELTIRYKQPVKTGDQLTFRGRVVAHRGRLYETSGEVVNTDGVVLAEATAKYLQVREELKSILSRSIE